MPKSNLYLKQLEIGPMQNFIYLIGDSAKKEVAVVDPAWDADAIFEETQKENLTIKAIFLTHGHMDHKNAVSDLLSIVSVPVYISEKEALFYKPKNKQIKNVKDNEKIKIGDIEITCLHTPGHTPGGLCFLCEDCLITGDTLFIDGCGRCDLPGGDPEVMYDTLYNKIMPLPDSTTIFPGHQYGPRPSDTLGNQKKTNPYLRAKNRDEFFDKRMGTA